MHSSIAGAQLAQGGVCIEPSESKKECMGYKDTMTQSQSRGGAHPQHHSLD